MNAVSAKAAPAAAFSLVEVIVAMVVLAVAVVGLAQGITAALRASKDSEWQTTAAFLAAGQIELLRSELFLTEGVSEGTGSGQLSAYRWKESVKTASIPGLYEVTVEVRRDAEAPALYELKTLLFDPPAGSKTNSPADSDRASRSRNNRRRNR